MNEVWKNIPDWNGLYQASNFGRIKSLMNQYGKNPELIVKSALDHRGYPKVCIGSRNIRKTCFVHRLIALTFIPNPENKREVNHINGIKSDNRVDNLEWNTPSENMKHAFAVLGKKPPVNTVYYSGKDHSRSRSVHQIDILSNKVINTFESINIAQKTLRIGNIMRTIKRNGIAGGFKWKYA